MDFLNNNVWLFVLTNFFLFSYWLGVVKFKLESDHNRINQLIDEVKELKEIDRDNLLREIEDLKR